jgi:hypothetical protein
MRHAREDELTARQEKAIIALINETTVARAAEASGIGERTLHRWLQEAQFVEAYRKARRDAFSQAIALTQRYAPLAVTTLAKVMNDPVSPYTAKVSAASAMLKFGREGIEMDDLAARLDQLEGMNRKDRP